MDEIKPMLFVVMPFGKKRDSTGSYEIDFDQVYEQAIKPAATAPETEQTCRVNLPLSCHMMRRFCGTTRWG